MQIKTTYHSIYCGSCPTFLFFKKILCFPHLGAISLLLDYQDKSCFISEANFIKIRSMHMTESPIFSDLLPRLSVLYFEPSLFIHISILLEHLGNSCSSKSNFDLMISDSFLTESVLSPSIVSIINSTRPFSIFLEIYLDETSTVLWKVVALLIVLKV